jgi:hypothetical protein
MMGVSSHLSAFEYVTHSIKKGVYIFQFIFKNKKISNIQTQKDSKAEKRNPVDISPLHIQDTVIKMLYTYL